MERSFMQKLVEWKNSANRKPMLLKGARQVGKTHIVLEFGKKYYDNIVYVHFEGGAETLKNIFKPDLDPKRIIRELSAYDDKIEIFFKNFNKTSLGENQDFLFYSTIKTIVVACDNYIVTREKTFEIDVLIKETT